MEQTPGDALPETLRAADSFRVRGPAHHGGPAQVRGAQEHLARFSAAVRATAPEKEAELPEFYATALPQIAAAGTGFPRLEVTRAGALLVSIRPLPELRTELVMCTVHERDFPVADRATEAPTGPALKGPRIQEYAAANRAVGAEALFCAADGTLREGATTSLIWWDGDTCVVAPSAGRVASVTEALVREAAQRLGYRVRIQHTSVEHLVAREVWALNALHGIRVVTALDGTELSEAEHSRLVAFRSDLDDQWGPLV